MKLTFRSSNAKKVENFFVCLLIEYSHLLNSAKLIHMEFQ